MTTREQLVIENNKLVKKTLSVPELGDHDVLVEVKAVAINPTDWKHVALDFGNGTSAGNDFSGTVVKVGKAVTSVRIGDNVNGGVGGGDKLYPEVGSFTNLLKTRDFMVQKLGKLEHAVSSQLPATKTITTFEGAASVSLTLWTVCLALVHYHNTPLVKGCKTGAGYAVVYGAGTSLGWYAVQVLHYLGYKVIGVASKRNEETLKGLGADYVVDYHEKAWQEQVREVAGDDVVYIYDTVSENGTNDEAIKVASRTKPVGFDTSLEPQFSTEPPKNVTVNFVLYYFLFVHQKQFGPTTYSAPKGLPEDAKRVLAEVSKIVEQGFLVQQPIKVIGEGFEAIPKALDASREGTAGPLTKPVVRF